jgi:hypothetical protein
MISISFISIIGLLGVLLLFTTPTATITSPSLQQNVYAQDNEEEEKEQEEPEEESGDSKDEDKEEQEEEEPEEKEESEEGNNNEEQTPTAEPNITAVPEQAPLPVINVTVNPQIINLTQPVANTPQIISTPQAQPPLEQFNATCSCFTTTDNKPPTQSIIPQQQQEAATASPPQPLQQIPISNVNIKEFVSSGQITDPAYTNYYTVPNLFDNVVDDKSYWSQAGKSNFHIQFDTILDNYQVCSMELSVYNPKNTPYLLDIGLPQTYSGIIDQMNEKIQFDNCVKNMDEILMVFDNPPGSYLSVAELKLFGKKLGDEPTPTPTPQPNNPQPQPNPQPSAPYKIDIKDSTAEVDIKNSTITFKFDKESAQATDYNVITIPNAQVVK